jgi:hypothetical protein
LQCADSDRLSRMDISGDQLIFGEAGQRDEGAAKKSRPFCESDTASYPCCCCRWGLGINEGACVTLAVRHPA